MLNHKRLVNYVLVGILFFFIFYFRFKFLYPYAATWDQVDFVLALKEFDLLKMQPHFPGYPFFILGGIGVGGLFDYGPESFSFLNHLLMLSASFPIYFISREWLLPFQSFLVVTAIHALSYPAVMIAQPMSEGAALAIIFWFLWSILYASKKRKLIFDLLPLLLFSFLLGIRLSYISFGIALIYHFYLIWKRNESYRLVQLFIYSLFAVFFQLFWVGALASNVGGFGTLWEIGFGFSEGHFTEWGGTAEEGNFLLRLLKLIFINTIWVGLASENIVLLITLVTFAAIAVLQWKKMRMQTFAGYYKMLLFCTGAYFAWALLAQNIDKPRHILPLVFLLMLLFLIKLIQINKTYIYIILFSWIIVHMVNSKYLLEKQATELPAVYQLEEYLSEEQDEFIIYTWEEMRTFDYLKSSFSYKRVFTYKLFTSELKVNKNKRVLLTNHVLEGFRSQGITTDDKVIKLETFVSDPLFDPVYSRIELYEWVD